MLSSKPKTLISCVIVIIASTLFFAGCSDNPKDKAGKQLQQSAKKGLDIAETTGDIEKGRKEIKAALSKAQQVGAPADTGLLADGNLILAQSQELLSALYEYANPIDIKLNDISLAVREVNNLQVDQERLVNLIAGSDKALQELAKRLDAENQTTGLRSQANQVNARLSRLQQRESLFQEQAAQGQKKANEIQQLAEDMLRKAERLSGDKKLQMEKEAYDLLLGKKGYDVAVQSALDQAKSMQSEIAIVEPLAKKLQADISTVLEKIQAIKSSPLRGQLKAQLNDIKKELDAYTVKIGKLTEGLKSSQAKHSQKLEEILSLLAEGAKNYKKIKQKTIRKMASARLGDCYFWVAFACADNMKFQERIAGGLGSMANAIEGSLSDAVQKAALEYAEISAEYAEKAMDNFDLAIEAYSKISNRGQSDDFACDVTKSHVLTLYGKIALADLLGKYEIAEAALTESEDLMEKASDCDPAFPTSVTARLFTGDVDYIPSMAIDSSVYYAEMKKQFQDWKTMRGLEKETEIRRLLSMLEEIEEHHRDPEEFERTIGPEKTLLEKALAKGEETGFEEEEEEEEEEVYDPNTF